MVAGGSSSSVLSNLLGSLTTALLAPVVAAYNGAVDVVNSTIAGGIAGAASGLANGIRDAAQTEKHIVALIPAGAAGANNLISAISSATFLNGLTSPSLNPVNI